MLLNVNKLAQGNLIAYVSVDIILNQKLAICDEFSWVARKYLEVFSFNLKYVLGITWFSLH